MKIIILILAHDDGWYHICQSIWKSYMNTHPHINSYFIKHRSDMTNDFLLENDTIYIKGNESMIPGCLEKTIQSIIFILN